MEKKFISLKIKSLEFNLHQSDVAKSFEFDLFKDSQWFPLMNEWDQRLNVISFKENQKVNQKENQNENKKQIAKINDDQNVSVGIVEKITKKVVFVGDTYKGEGDDLLAKMISAMKLKPSEVLRISFDNNLEEITDLEENRQKPNEAFVKFLKQIEEFSPDYVVSFGAIATNLLLGRREKMSAIHGKLFDVKGITQEFKLMPVFHPEFLIINPNMKRTAWQDLQKIMEYMGKI